MHGYDDSVVCRPHVAWWAHRKVAEALLDHVRRNGTRYPDVVWDWVAGLKHAAAVYERERVAAVAPPDVALDVASATGSDATSCKVDAMTNEVTVAEYADAVGRGPATIRKRIQRGRLPARPTPSGYRIRRENFDAELEVGS